MTDSARPQAISAAVQAVVQNGATFAELGKEGRIALVFVDAFELAERAFVERR